MKKTIVCILSLVFLLTGCSVFQSGGQTEYQLKDESVMVDLDSVEYKILINPNLLTDEAGYQEIWNILKTTADQQGISLEAEDKPFKLGYRNIQYLDTGNLELRQKGYTLRYRQKYKKFKGFGDSKNKLKTKYDVTLKYRSQDQATALDSKITAGAKRFGKAAKAPELEADITLKGIIFSHAAKLKLKEEKNGSFADLFDYSVKGEKGYSTMFPILANLDMVGKYIIPVADTTVVEAKAEPGKLVFSKDLKPEIAISIFHDTENKPFVGEVSFDFDIAGKNHTATFDELKQIEAYYTALINNLGERIYEGTTKTAYVYKLAK